MSRCITAIFAAALSYFTLKFSDGDLETKASENKKFAAKVHALRNKYETLMYEIKGDHLKYDEILERCKELEDIENKLYSEPAPYTSAKAVRKAENALKGGRESTTEEDEIRSIVPIELQEFNNKQHAFAD